MPSTSTGEELFQLFSLVDFGLFVDELGRIALFVQLDFVSPQERYDPSELVKDGSWRQF